MNKNKSWTFSVFWVADLKSKRREADAAAADVADAANAAPPSPRSNSEKIQIESKGREPPKTANYLIHAYATHIIINQLHSSLAPSLLLLTPCRHHPHYKHSSIFKLKQWFGLKFYFLALNSIRSDVTRSGCEGSFAYFNEFFSVDAQPNRQRLFRFRFRSPVDNCPSLTFVMMVIKSSHRSNSSQWRVYAIPMRHSNIQLDLISTHLFKPRPENWISSKSKFAYINHWNWQWPTNMPHSFHCQLFM